MTWHMFRHTFASRLTRDLDIVTVKEFMGTPTSTAPCAMLIPMTTSDTRPRTKLRLAKLATADV